MLKKFQVGRYKFQVGVGGKTWKCVLIKVETATKTHRNMACVRVEKLRGMFQCQNGFFQLRVEISTLVVLVTVSAFQVDRFGQI